METGTDGVLIVDDDQDLRETLVHIVREAGYPTHEARDGIDAFRQLDAGLRPCLILLDAMMPKMSGAEFLQKRGGDLAQIPVVVITAFEHVAGLESAEEILHKPFDVTEVLAEVRAYCC